MIKQSFQNIKNCRQNLKILIPLSLVSFIFAGIHLFKDKKQAPKEMFQISDVIPEGFVMIPVELENHAAIQGLISSHGVVDLYQALDDFSPPHRFAESVRMVRSQANQFSVLIDETLAASFVRSQRMFHAVIRNSNKKGSQVYPLQLKRKRHIIVGEGL